MRLVHCSRGGSNGLSVLRCLGFNSGIREGPAPIVRQGRQIGIFRRALVS
jgi:hypothetical protein